MNAPGPANDNRAPLVGRKRRSRVLEGEPLMGVPPVGGGALTLPSNR